MVARADKLRAAAALYRDFSGHEAQPVGRVRWPGNPGVGVAIGKTVGVGYEAIRDGERRRYYHAFSKSARPLLASSFDGREVYLLGGDYTFTERGIVDTPRVKGSVMPTPLMVINPSSRRKSRKSSTHRSRHVTLVGGAQHRRVHRMRRNPARALAFPGLPGLNVSNLGVMMRDAGVGGVGAIGVDLAMGGAVRLLPIERQGRYNADGSLNWVYFALKAGIAVLVGAVVPRFLPNGAARTYIRAAAAGSLTVQAYDLIKANLPASALAAMGYFNPVPTLRQPALAGAGQTMGAAVTRGNVTRLRGAPTLGATFTAPSRRTGMYSPVPVI